MKQTVTSKYEPKSKNVTWIDMSTGSPVLKNFINGMWRPTGGGGGAGSSNPTEDDATKVWQVTPVLKETKTEETVIVPEQTLVNEQELEYNDKFVPGAQCVAVVNGVEYRGEVIEDEPAYIFRDASFGSFEYSEGMFKFWDDTGLPEVIAKLSIIEETPIYDYNWASGVKIPIPTAKDEGKILVVTKVEGDNTSTIVPEQQVPADSSTPLTDVDLTKFVVGNTVKATVIYEGQPITETGVIEEFEGIAGVAFTVFQVWKGDNLLYTNADTFGPNSTIKLEYIEQNYEYQLQENSGGSSDVLWPALYKNEFGNEVMATFVPEDVKPNTWCMVCGTNSNSQPVCYPVLINEYSDYTLYSGVGGLQINVSLAFGGAGGLLNISSNTM